MSASKPESKFLATVTVDPILHEGLGPLFPIVTAENDSRETLLALMPNTVCVITRGPAPIDTEIMEASPDLRVVTRTGAGYENVDIAAATALGIPVLHAPLLAESVAEGTFTMMLALTKNLFHWHRALLEGRWDRRATERTDELYEKTLGIVGLGRIGRAVARRALAFDMRVLGYDPYIRQTDLDGIEVTLVALEDLLSSSDIVSLHTLVTPETEGMIDRAKIRAMKPGAYIVNFGRGALIDGLDILYEALEDGHLAGVGLDVFPDEPPANTDHPLFRHPNFVGDPHVLASTAGAEARCSRSVVRDVSAVLRGERPEWCINPEVFEAANLRPPALGPGA